MAMHEIPRDTGGESKILMIFSTKALIYTAIGIGLGLVFYWIFKMIEMKIVGLVFIAIFALIGFTIGTFKVPETDSFYITRQCGGSRIDDVIKRAFTFYLKKKPIYVYTEEEEKDDVK